MIICTGGDDYLLPETTHPPASPLAGPQLARGRRYAVCVATIFAPIVNKWISVAHLCPAGRLDQQHRRRGDPMPLIPNKLGRLQVLLDGGGRGRCC